MEINETLCYRCNHPKSTHDNGERCAAVIHTIDTVSTCLCKHFVSPPSQPSCVCGHDQSQHTMINWQRRGNCFYTENGKMCTCPEFQRKASLEEVLSSIEDPIDRRERVAKAAYTARHFSLYEHVPVEWEDLFDHIKEQWRKVAIAVINELDGVHE